MTRAVTRLVTALLVAAVCVVAQGQPASAVEGDKRRLNMWQHDGYEGHHEPRKTYDSNLHNDSCSDCDPGPGGNFGDDMSSYVNRTQHWWYLYVDTRDGSGRTGYGGMFCVRPRSKDGDLGNNGYSDLEDEISAVLRGGKGHYDDHDSPDHIDCDRIIGHRI